MTTRAAAFVRQPFTQPDCCGGRREPRSRVPHQKPTLGAALQAKSGQEIVVEFHPNRVAGVDLGLGDPRSVAAIHPLQGR